MSILPYVSPSTIAFTQPSYSLFLEYFWSDEKNIGGVRFYLAHKKVNFKPRGSVFKIEKNQRLPQKSVGLRNRFIFPYLKFWAYRQGHKNRKHVRIIIVINIKFIPHGSKLLYGEVATYFPRTKLVLLRYYVGRRGKGECVSWEEEKKERQQIDKHIVEINIV